MKSVNPANNELINEYEEYSNSRVGEIVGAVGREWHSWKKKSLEERAYLTRKLARIFLAEEDECSALITSEMGKVIREARAEVKKCAMICDFYADHASAMLKDEIIKTEYKKSLVTFQPLGVVLEIMPWNFPFWQVLRFSIPAMMAGNTIVLKHASNVSGCALKIEELFRKAEFPQNAFRVLLISSTLVADVIKNPIIKAIGLTGSELAGSKVAETAGSVLKKTVLELGGSDSYIILEDADLDRCVNVSIRSRTGNAGQACIAAKRFIIVRECVDEFVSKQKERMESLIIGNPFDENTQLAPLARKDLVDEIHAQVEKSIAMGATLITGGKKLDGPGNYYAPTILTNVKKGMPVFDEETFGPVAAVITVENEEEAITAANDSDFGLGGSVWTEDIQRGERIARQIETGTVVVNNMTASNPRLPFGGIKKSGFGRELSHYGIKEFVNIKTINIQQ